MTARRSRRAGVAPRPDLARATRVGRPAAQADRWGRLERDVLGNGLRVLTAEAPSLHSAMVGLYVRSGSRHEAASAGGVSHLLEHLLFRGSVGWPDSVAMNAAVESAGGNLNGVTARDHGCYYTPIHPGELATGVAVLGDLVRRPLLRDIEVEREVILEEILDEVDADGRDVDSDNLVKRLVYRGHPLARKIGGTPESVRALTLRQVRAHLERFYTGENLVLAVAGPVRHEQVLELAGRHLGPLPRGLRSADRAPPPWPTGPLLELVDHEDAQSEFTLAFPCPHEQHPDYPVFLVIRRLLDDGLSSRLPFEVVEKRGLAYALHCGLDTFADSGMLLVDGACSPAKLGRVLDRILSVLAQLGASPVPDHELLRVQRRHRMMLDFSLDSPAELVGWYGTGEVLSAPESFEARCRRVEAVTAADVRRVALATFRRTRMAGVVVGRAGPRERRVIERFASGGGPLPS